MNTEFYADRKLTQWPNFLTIISINNIWKKKRIKHESIRSAASECAVEWKRYQLRKKKTRCIKLNLKMIRFSRARDGEIDVLRKQNNEERKAWARR